MSTHNLDAKKQRIKKLLELSKSPNENEAAAALEKANILMEEYAISETDCHSSSYVEVLIKTTKRYSSYRARLINSICWLYSVYFFREPYLGAYRFFGNEIDVFCAQEMYSYLVKTVDRMAKQNIRKNAKKPYRNSYRIGVVGRITSRIYIMGQSVSWAPERERRMDTIKIYVKSIYTLEDEKLKTKKLNKTAYNRGWSAGANVGLNRQQTGSGGRSIEFQ